MLKREQADFVRVVRGLADAGSTVDAAISYAALLTGHPKPTEPEYLQWAGHVRAARGKGRPVQFSKSLDAAWLFRELRLRGMAYRQALEVVETLLSVGKSGVERYQKHRLEPMDERSDRTMAGAVLARWWGLVRDGLPRLNDQERESVADILAEDWTFNSDTPD